MSRSLTLQRRAALGVAAIAGLLLLTALLGTGLQYELAVPGACLALVLAVWVRLTGRSAAAFNGHREDELRAARRIVERHGEDSISPFILRPDKAFPVRRRWSARVPRNRQHRGRLAIAWRPPRRRRPALAASAPIRVAGALLLVATLNASYALADNLRLTAVLWHRLPPPGPWLEAVLFAAGAALPPLVRTLRWGRADGLLPRKLAVRGRTAKRTLEKAAA